MASDAAKLSSDLASGELSSDKICSGAVRLSASIELELQSVECSCAPTGSLTKAVRLAASQIPSNHSGRKEATPDMETNQIYFLLHSQL